MNVLATVRSLSTYAYVFNRTGDVAEIKSQNCAESSPATSSSRRSRPQGYYVDVTDSTSATALLEVVDTDIPAENSLIHAMDQVIDPFCRLLRRAK